MDVKPVVSVNRRVGENVGYFGVVWVYCGVTCLVEGERRGGVYDREETGIGVGNELRFERNCLGPWVEAVLFYFYGVVSRGKIEFVVCNCC